MGYQTPDGAAVRAKYDEVLKGLPPLAAERCCKQFCWHEPHRRIIAANDAETRSPLRHLDQGDFFADPIEKKDFAPVAVFRDWILREAATAAETRR